MNINNQFQNLHTKDTENQWTEKQFVERDILLLFHQLSNYSYLMGDLYYLEVFNLQYWKYLNYNYWKIDIKEEDRLFIEIGCLVMIATMAWEIIDGSGSYILKFLDEIITVMELYNPKHIETIELKEMVLKTVIHAKNGKESNEELGIISIDIHKKYIRKYFKEKAFDFDNNRYFRN